MKYKTTKKAVMNGYYKVLAVPYCALQHLLHYESEIAYTTRAEGWGADVYQFGSIAIATGYAPFGNIRPDYEVNQRYEEKAREATEGIYNWQEKKAILAGLIEEYIQEVTTK